MPCSGTAMARKKTAHSSQHKTVSAAGKRRATSRKTPPAELANIPVTAENKCSLCVQSICCTYITHQISTPRSMEDFDYLIWQVSHDNVALFKDEDGWFLSVAGRCSHLLPGGNCGIYDNRPQICREHSNDCCEYDGAAEEDFQLYFNSFETLEVFCRKKFKNWDKRFKKWRNKDASVNS
jgi:Fe-S-cluster containining protein